ncbi:histidinol-phosphate transaminase [Gammaproteobacteria bacterium]|nr:histidinol-phosphate transaminase [Gammaproteobacteria bacterium]
MKNKINNFLRDDIDLLKEYEIFDSTNMIKLDAMENPFDLNINFEITGLPSGTTSLNRYPDADCRSIRNKLLTKYQLDDKKYDAIIGNGSDELIQLICLTFLRAENIVLCPAPSFSMYKKISQVIGLRYEEVPLRNNFSLDIKLMLEKIKDLNPAIIFLAYPNNPTGNLWSKEDIEAIIKQSNGVVVVDEAYGAFSRESFISKIDEFENLIIMKTFSKVGLAGIRLGYLFSNKYIIKQINKLRLPFNINSISQKISEISIDSSYLEDQIEEIILLRSSLILELRDIKKIEVYDSKTNFILFKILEGSANEVFESLLSDNILIKNMSKMPGLKNFLRVTIGSKKENNLFIQSLKNAII